MIDVQTYEGYTPFVHQEEVHIAITNHIESTIRFEDAFQKTFIVNSRRQVGKSLMAENEFLRFGINYENSFNLYIAPSFGLCRKVYEEIIDAAKDTDLIARQNATTLTIRLNNGSILQFASSEQRDNLRGLTVSGIMIIDEASFIPSDFYYNVLTPFVDFYRAITLIISTPKFKSGFFYDTYVKGLSGASGYKSFNFMDHDLSHIVSKSRLEELKSLLPEDVFRSEYLGLFLDSESLVFGNFKASIIDYVPAFEKLYIGLDWGSGTGNDNTVMTGVNERGQQVFIWKTNKMSPTRQVQAIAKFINKYADKIEFLIAEKNSIGDIYIDMLRNACETVSIIPFVTTNQSKRKCVNKLQVAFQNVEINILDNDTQKNELEFFMAKLNSSTNTVSFGAPDGMHDDHVVALMLAWHAYTLGNNMNLEI